MRDNDYDVQEDYLRHYRLVHEFDKWLNDSGNNPPDPESVRDIQRYWKSLKKSYMIG